MMFFDISVKDISERLVFFSVIFSISETVSVSRSEFRVPVKILCLILGIDDGLIFI